MSGGMETIAVYSEETVRTYGFEIHRGLVLVTLTPMAAALDLEAALHHVGIASAHLRMATAQGQPDGTLLIQVVLEPGASSSPRPDAPDHPVHAVDLREPVEVISFQGPHFGDRYGIATRVFAELQTAEIEPLTVGCTGASIYLAVAEGLAERAVEALRRSFAAPGDPSPSGEEPRP